MTPGPEADRVLLAHIRECLQRIQEYTAGDRARFESSRLVQDATLRNLQTLAESSQRLSNDIKGTEPGIPWRELSGFRNVRSFTAIWAWTWRPSGWSSSTTCPRWSLPQTE